MTGGNGVYIAINTNGRKIPADGLALKSGFYSGLKAVNSN